MSKYYVIEKNSTFVIYNNFEDLEKELTSEPKLTFETFDTLKSVRDYIKK